MKILISTLCILCLLSACQPTNPREEVIEDPAIVTALFYDQLIAEEAPNVSNLNPFFTAMPKGGDLNHHYAGSLYAETFMYWI